MYFYVFLCMFLIYINDLPNASILKALLFADDTTLLASHADVGELCTLVNKEFKKITDYFRANLLSLHPAKTKFIFFSNSRNLDVNTVQLFIDNNNDDQQHSPELKHSIARIVGDQDEPSFRFLGLYLDPNLSYANNAQRIIKKISSALFVMRKAKNVLNKSSLKLLYYSLIHSHIIYAIQVWSSCPPSLINKIHRLQKQAVRIIHGAKYNAHSEPLFKSLNILPVADLISFFRLQFMQKFSFGLLPSSFTTTWTTNAARNLNLNNLHAYPLRNSENLFIPTSRLVSLEKHPLYLLPKIWSDFVDPIKFIRNKTEFNCKLKRFFLNTLSATLACSRLFCPSCLRTGTN